jgi:hypothetical protein
MGIIFVHGIIPVKKNIPVRNGCGIEKARRGPGSKISKSVRWLDSPVGD